MTTSLGRLVRPSARPGGGPPAPDAPAPGVRPAPGIPASDVRPAPGIPASDVRPAPGIPASDVRPALDVGPASGFRSTAPVRPASAVRRVAADGAAAAVMAMVTPLCLLQAPDAIAWALNTTGGVAAGPQGPAAVLRAAGLALPAMAAVAGIAALTIVRLRAWPVLLTGLMVMAASDALGGSARTVTAIAVVRVLHGVAAGLALPAALALAWERAPVPRRWLAGLWSAAMVAGLAAAPSLTRERLVSGGWHAALAPYPWLTGAALTVAALYAVLAAGPGGGDHARPSRHVSYPSRADHPSRSGDDRNSSHAGHLGAGYRPAAGPAPQSQAQATRPPRARQDATQERAQLAVLAVPGLGLAALSVAITYRPPAALLATAAVAVFILYGMAAVASADRLVGGPLCFPVIGAVTGLVVAPASGAIASVRAFSPGSSGGLSWLPLGVTAAAAMAGVAAALVLRRRPRAVVLAGLVIAVEGLAAARLAGPDAAGLVLAGVSAPLAGGLAAAMTAALADAGVASALSGVSLLLAGLVTGYLASGAVQVRMVTKLTAGPAVLHTAERLALASAVGVWELAGLCSVLIAIAVTILVGRARRSGAATR